jgi:hypothetical protein
MTSFSRTRSTLWIAALTVGLLTLGARQARAGKIEGSLKPLKETDPPVGSLVPAQALVVQAGWPGATTYYPLPQIKATAVRLETASRATPLELPEATPKTADQSATPALRRPPVLGLGSLLLMGAAVLLGAGGVLRRRLLSR